MGVSGTRCCDSDEPVNSRRLKDASGVARDLLRRALTRRPLSRDRRLRGKRQRLAPAAAVIADATPRVHEQFAALIVFVVVASLGVAAPVIIRGVLGARSDRLLAVADEWMTRYNAVIMSAVLLILGVVLIINGMAGL